MPIIFFYQYARNRRYGSSGFRAACKRLPVLVVGLARGNGLMAVPALVVPLVRVSGCADGAGGGQTFLLSEYTSLATTPQI